jgi:hypothetical protein
MHQRDEKRRDDRNRQQDIGNGDLIERDERHPDQIEQRGAYGDGFGDEPVESAQQEFVLLVMVEPAGPGQELASVFPHDLHRAAGPSSPLNPEGLIILRPAGDSKR